MQDLLQFPSTQAIADAPIHPHQNAHTVRHFVDYVTSAKHHDVRLSFKGFQHLLDLCDHLQCSGIEKSVLGALKNTLKRKEYPFGFNPWEVFVLAAQRDDLALAKCAIGFFDRPKVAARVLIVLKSTTPPYNTSSRYYDALLRCAVDPETSCRLPNGAFLIPEGLRSVEQMVEGFSLD